MSTAAKRKDDSIKVNRVKAVLNLIPSSEAWLYKNRKALDSVQKGLTQAAKGKITRLNLDKL